MIDQFWEAMRVVIAVFLLSSFGVALLTWLWSSRMDAAGVERGQAAQRGRDVTASSFGLGALFNLIEAIRGSDIDHWAFTALRAIVVVWFVASIWYWALAEYRRHQARVRSRA